VFVCAEPVLTGRHFWFDTLWRRSGEQAVTQAMSLPYAEWRALADAIATPTAETDAHRPMTPTELRRLAASPLVEIGGHTMRHPVLRCAPIDEQRDEISGCRTALQDAIGKPIRGFAYPFGRVADHYQPETARVIEAAGFDLAITTNESFVPGGCDPFQLPRFVMLGSVDDAELAHRLVDSWRAAATAP
jgi:peptidoglycan/xylan/chitin deacetylase (PgdA/CDA1 family)